jgi:NADPH:quinone reductase
MRSWQVEHAGEPAAVLRLVERDSPEPGPGQVRIKVAAAGIGLPDVLMCRGQYPLTPPVPFTPGQEFSGTVLAAGPGVDLAVGTRIMGVSDFIGGNGSFAEEALADAALVFPAIDHLDDCAVAGIWIPNMTAWIALVDRGRLQAGQRLAVLGAAGGTGIAAVQLGKALGAEVFAVVGDESRGPFCRSFGADHVLVDKGGTGADGTPLAQALRQLTGGHGADLVFDPVGGAQGSAAMGALARDGRHLAIGFASGAWPTVDVQMMVMMNTSLVGVIAAGYSREHLDAILRELTGLVEKGTLKGMVAERVSFAAVPDALTRLAARETLGKLVIDVSAG